MTLEIADIVAGRNRWLRFEQPFPHVVGTDVFRAEVYRAMEQQFRAWLDRGLSDTPTGTDTMFSRAMGKYDAYGYNFSHDNAGAFTVLLSRAWCTLLADIFDVKTTHHANLGLHHHLPGSRSGWPHTDLAPGWFLDDVADPDWYSLSDPALIDYQTGRVHAAGESGVEEVRSVAALFYLANEPWRPGDGGETALFAGAGNDPDRECWTVPPVNNSILVFECTPFSFHTFRTNVRKPRNSLVMWLHRPKAVVTSRWDSRSIVNWTTDGHR